MHVAKNLYICTVKRHCTMPTLRHISLLLLLFLPMLLPGSAAAWGRERIIVVDAGHGGHDAGCVGRSEREKDINLDVAQRLARKINAMPGYKAVLTRDSDVFLTLQKRADIANEAGADLFISIHVNSVARESAGRERVAGASVYALGPDKAPNNLNVAMRENSVMELEKDHTTRYKGFDPKSSESYIMFELTQNAHQRQSLEFARLAQQQLVSHAGRTDKGVRQDGFWVLWATGMPAVLVELDFICNPECERFLASGDGREKCAQALANAVKAHNFK